MLRRRWEDSIQRRAADYFLGGVGEGVGKLPIPDDFLKALPPDARSKGDRGAR